MSLRLYNHRTQLEGSYIFFASKFYHSCTSKVIPESDQPVLRDHFLKRLFSLVP